MSQSSYIVTARKYRPQVFMDLVGQGHVAETLKNAIQFDRLAHAYLFSGPRGVGKTTSARILAKAINCTTPLSDRDHGEPCRSCESCESFEEGRSLNIIEIDAASNNSVDDVRSLREKVTIPPQGAVKKVYIIDEVHMLSNQAFNALLKTLEEPPPFVLFIFATTEPHKVLPTILSRCQRFDFRRISVQDGVTHLRDVCEAEGVVADDESLTLIARKGDGALRDMLSVLDQSIALCDGKLKYPELARALGVIDLDRFFEVSRLVVDRDSAGVFSLVDDLTRAGTDYSEFFSGLAEHFRHLLVACTLGEATLIEASSSVQNRYLEESKSFTETDLLHMLQMVAGAESASKASSHPRLQLELALLKMVQFPGSVAISELIEKIDQLRNETSSSSPSGSGHTGKHVQTTAAEQKNAGQRLESLASTIDPEKKTNVGTSSTAAADMSNSVESSAETKEPKTEDIEIISTDSDAPHPAEEVPRSAGKSETVVSGGNLSSNNSNGFITEIFGKPALPKSGNSVSDKETGNSLQNKSGNRSIETAQLHVPENGKYTPVKPEEEDRQFYTIKKKWPEILESVRESRIHVNALLQHARPDHAADGQVALAVPDSFHVQMLSQQKTFLEQKIQELLALKTTPVLVFFVDEAADEGDKKKAESEADPFQSLQHLKQHNAALRALMDQFGAEIVW